MQLETLQDLYGTARTYAEMLGDNEGAKLRQTLRRRSRDQFARGGRVIGQPVNLTI